MSSSRKNSVCEMTDRLTQTEHTLAVLWTEVLQLAQMPGRSANFFALGGDSMAMVMLEFRIKEEFSVQIPAGATLRAPSLCELAALIDAED